MKTALAAILTATILSLAGVTPAPVDVPTLEPVCSQGSADVASAPIAAAPAPLTPTAISLEATSGPEPLPPSQPEYLPSAALHPASEGWTFNGLYVDGVFIPADQCRPEDLAGIESGTP